MNVCINWDTPGMFLNLLAKKMDLRKNATILNQVLGFCVVAFFHYVDVMENK